MISTNLGHPEASQVGYTEKVMESPVLLDRRDFRINYSLDTFLSKPSLAEINFKNQK